MREHNSLLRILYPLNMMRAYEAPSASMRTEEARTTVAPGLI